jgi:hypothetical protein
VLQRSAVTREDFDAECERLAPQTRLNPHRSWLPGMGDYDANVLVNILQAQQCEVRFVDRRQRPLQLSLESGALCGFVVNVKRPRNFLFRLLGSGRHWFAIAHSADSMNHSDDACENQQQKQRREWALLDSLSDTPRLFANEAELLEYMEALVDDPDLDLNLLVVERRFDDAVS